jgi:hypothetical protein
MESDWLWERDAVILIFVSVLYWKLTRAPSKSYPGVCLIPADNNIEYNQSPSRTSNSKQVLSATTEIAVYKHSFFPRTVKDWNTPTESAVSSKTVEGFKAAISCD